ncbi:MAG: DUF2069 domain-containing protein [Burkholderiales bacterium]|nr:DUF2069 domain-containing protein [Burkholderiales bacterium]
MPAVTASPAPEAPPATLAAGLHATVTTTRLVAVGSVLALIALGLAWELWLAPTGQRTWALKVLPLVAAVVGLLKHRLYTYRWLSLLVWLYFAEGMVRATSSQGLVVGLAWAQALLSLLLFGACVVHVRWRLKRAKAAGLLPPSKAAGPAAREPAP